MNGQQDPGAVPKGIDAGPVSAWLADEIAGARPPFRFSLITGGHSNLTFRVDAAEGGPLVLRRPPLGAVLATAHDMGREHRILTGVGQTGVPVPPVLGLCEDESVNGAPFYVMRFVEGVVLDSNERAATSFPEPDSRRALGEHVVEVLADLHRVDPDAVGLGDLGRKEAYLDRQLKRWRTQWEKSKTRELPAMEETYELLLEAKPEQAFSGIVHGDYRLGNMLSGADARIAAVLDWELCTLGDPLADVGYLLNDWVEPGDPGAGDALIAPTAAGGFPSRDEVVRAYAERIGREVTGIEYYQSFQSWRLAAIVEGVMARYLKGVMGDSKANTDVFRTRIDALADRALKLIRKLA